MQNLGFALMSYISETGKIPPVRSGESGASPRWYDEEWLGPYIGGPFQRHQDPSGSYAVPPPDSPLECPSLSVGDFDRPYASWIGLNNQASLRWFRAPWQPTLRYEPGVITGVNKPLSKVVAFADSSGFGLSYISNYSGNDGSGFVGLSPWSGFNPRHQGGANYVFMDGHAEFIPDPDEAFFNKEMFLIPSTLHDPDSLR